jgi:aspartyl-tRNA(Asn)/glutamyl-tRNA(Gln) amidotransferase subunit A
MPIGIKDIIDVAGWPTKCGSKLREHVPPAEKDAGVVEYLRAAGAIFLGKTVTTEFACFDPPPTRNPWNLDHTPGGSSSGSAAAVATEMCMAAIGTQTGGSIIRPAAYCGICGFKPPLGILPMDGIMPLSAYLDHVGPMARTADDLEVVWLALKLGDRKVEAACVLERAEPPSALAVCESFFRLHSSADVWTAFSNAVERIESAGVAIRHWGLPRGFDEAHVMHRRIMAVDAASVHRSQFERSPENYSPHIAKLIEEGLQISQPDYVQAIEHQREFKRAVLLWACDQENPHDRDAWGVLVPATPTAAPPSLETTGDPLFNSPWSYGTHAANTIPIGLSDAGVPIGMQILSHWEFGLKISRFCQQVIPWTSAPALLSESSSASI